MRVAREYSQRHELGAKMHNISYVFLETMMAIRASDIVPLSQARARLSELADEVKAGGEKIITKNGEAYVALIDAAQLDHYHQLERERVHLLLIDDANLGLDDVEAGRVKDARHALQSLKPRHGR
jgi:prevent-host-death family protein